MADAPHAQLQKCRLFSTSHICYWLICILSCWYTITSAYSPNHFTFCCFSMRARSSSFAFTLYIFYGWVFVNIIFCFILRTFRADCGNQFFWISRHFFFAVSFPPRGETTLFATKFIEQITFMCNLLPIYT